MDATYASEIEPDSCDENPRVRRLIVGTPLLEVSSVTVESKENDSLFADRGYFELSGMVFVSMDFDVRRRVEFYSRDDDEPEIVPLGGQLSLDGTPVPPSTDFMLLVCLRDTFRYILIANATFLISYNSDNDYDNLQVVKICGDHTTTTVNYITFRSAALAELRVTLIRGSVFGTICASTEVRSGCNVSRVIFDKSKGQSVTAVDSDNHTLCTRHLAVPIHSSVKIKFNLSDSNTELPIDVGKVLDFHVVDNVNANLQTVIGSNFHIQVQVTWIHPYHNTDERTLRYSSEEEDSENEEHKPKKHRALVKEENEEQLASAFGQGRGESPITSPSCNVVSIGSVIKPLRLVDIYSIFIGLNDCAENLHLHGTIKVSDKMGVYCIFDRNIDNPLIMLPQTKMASIVWPTSSFKGALSKIELDLKDGKGRIISKGLLDWSMENVDEAYYNRRICSVIQGEHGYGTVHYTIFSAAVQTTVTVVLLHKYLKEVTSDVHGRLDALIGNRAYYTYLDENYYRSTLFERSEEDCVKVACGSAIPQSKYEVVVPAGSSLDVQANLCIRVLGDDNFEQLVGSAEIDAGSFQLITGINFEVFVRVDCHKSDVCLE